VKIIIPDQVPDDLPRRILQVAPGYEILYVSSDGEVRGDVSYGEHILLRWWGLSRAGFRRVVSETPNLRWIHTISAGVDKLLFPFLVESDILLTCAIGVYDVPIAELVLTFMLMAAKQMPEFLDYQKAHRWQRQWQGLQELYGTTVGIVGLGHIGAQVARLARAFGMRVVATKRHPEQGEDVADVLLPPERLYELLAQSDFVVIAVPLTSETYHLIDAQALVRMKPDAWLINIGRGPVLDEGALVRVLGEGKIGGACLDVFETEPLPEESSLWDLPNVIVTPHNAGLSNHKDERSAELFLENLRRFVAGEPLLNVVDKKLGNSATLVSN
jgi:phosphoglycerate dehydrogenase-like enzyme